jgi:hypothetical protein
MVILGQGEDKGTCVPRGTGKLALARAGNVQLADPMSSDPIRHPPGGFAWG